MGNLNTGKGIDRNEYIVIRREPPELKHLSRARKRNQPRFLPVVASERERGQTGSGFIHRGFGQTRTTRVVKRTGGKPAIEGESPVSEKMTDREADPEYRGTRETRGNR